LRIRGSGDTRNRDDLRTQVQNRTFWTGCSLCSWVRIPPTEPVVMVTDHSGFSGVAIRWWLGIGVFVGWFLW